MTSGYGRQGSGNLIVISATQNSPYAVVGTQGVDGGAITDWAAVSGGSIDRRRQHGVRFLHRLDGGRSGGQCHGGHGVDTTLSADAAINSLRFNLSEARTIALGGKTLNVGGILVTSAVGNNVSTISGGSLTTASAPPPRPT